MPHSHWLGLGPSWQLQPVPQADQYLADLLDLYWQGLHRPLPLFPRSAWAWSEAKGGEKGLEAARQYWQGNPQRRGDREDPYNQLLFAEQDPIGEDFAELAARIWLPLRKYSEDA
jgi:exodeoxyribonuclease V gamma subunit